MVTLSTEQKAYIAAKARYDTLYAEAQAYKAVELTEPDPEDREASKRYFEQEADIEWEIGVPQALTAMIKAEKALLEWARKAVKGLPQYAGRTADVDAMFEGAAHDLVFEQELIDMSLRFGA